MEGEKTKRRWSDAVNGGGIRSSSRLSEETKAERSLSKLHPMPQAICVMIKYCRAPPARLVYTEPEQRHGGRTVGEAQTLSIAQTKDEGRMGKQNLERQKAKRQRTKPYLNGSAVFPRTAKHDGRGVLEDEAGAMAPGQQVSTARMHGMRKKQWR